MNIQPVAGQLTHDFVGQAANEELPLHEKLLGCMALEHDDIVRPFRSHVIEIFKQMNLWTAQARQTHLQQGLYGKQDEIILADSYVGIWLDFAPAAWDQVIDSYMDDMRVNDPTRFQDIYGRVSDKEWGDPTLSAQDQELLRLAFEDHYKDGMSALHEVARLMQEYLPRVRAQIFIGHIDNAPEPAYVQPILKLSAPEGVDLRDIVRNFIERKNVVAVAPAP